MLKNLSICAAVAVLGISSANAQQREAVFQKIELENAGFDIVLAMAKPGAPNIDLRGEFDPSVLHFMGGELVHSYTGEVQALFDEISALAAPACAIHANGQDGKPQSPIAIYVVPKGETPLASTTK
jgi:hypothetical protein